jgi:hypothetical protein
MTAPPDAEELLDRRSERHAEPERELNRRVVVAFLDGDDGLPRDGDLGGKLGLAHFAPDEAEVADAVADAHGWLLVANVNQDLLCVKVP